MNRDRPGRPRPDSPISWSVPELLEFSGTSLFREKSAAGWSTYINGMQINYDKFHKEVLAACDHVRKNMSKAA